MYVANVSENGFENNPYLDAVSRRSAEEEDAGLRIKSTVSGAHVYMDN
mgnify:CR=1 FL=1